MDVLVVVRPVAHIGFVRFVVFHGRGCALEIVLVRDAPEEFVPVLLDVLFGAAKLEERASLLLVHVYVSVVVVFPDFLDGEFFESHV